MHIAAGYLMVILWLCYGYPMECILLAPCAALGLHQGSVAMRRAVVAKNECKGTTIFGYMQEQKYFFKGSRDKVPSTK